MTIGNISVLDTGNLSPFANGAVATYTDVVAGGTIVIASLANPPGSGLPASIAATFIPAAMSGATRNLSLVDANGPTGVPITATAGATGGAVGIVRSAGTSCVLQGLATSGNAKDNFALWQVNLPASYVAGANIPVIVNAGILGTGTLNAGSCTLTVQAFVEVNGVETALTVSASQTIVATPAPYTFTITGTGLTTYENVCIEVDGLVTSSSGANTLEINSVSFVA